VGILSIKIILLAGLKHTFLMELQQYWQLSIKIILLAGLKPKNINSGSSYSFSLSIKIILLAGLKRVLKAMCLVKNLSIKIILLAGLKRLFSPLSWGRIDLNCCFQLK
jgi:hypothetical protein